MSDSAHRHTIITTFAGRTVFSALRRSPVKSKKHIYPLLTQNPFGGLLGSADSAIGEEEFSKWHQDAVKSIETAEPDLGIGWAVKILNVYLKTAAYVGNLGRPGLQKLLHPPIDGGLWDGMKKWIATSDLSKAERKELKKKTHRVRKIKDIKDYGTYQAIISGCRVIALKVPCLLVEVDHLWEGATASDLVPVLSPN
jgi:hypothetical protein